MPREKPSYRRVWPSDRDEEDDLINQVQEDETFHLGQVYDKVAATTLECAKCGSREFNVGAGSYLTVLRCPKCEWEYVWHDG